ncbi:MAG: redoxin domain-containing protein [Prevotella sp.]|nr:redoxin domain-containing protein [Prevotella sp.]
MRNTIFSMALAAAALVPGTTLAADGNVHFKGDIKGLKDTLIVITPNKDNQRDTVLTPGGKFEFSVDVAEPTSLLLYTPGTLRQEEKVGFQVLAVPGESAEIKGDLQAGYYYSGSQFYEQYNEADRAMEVASKPLRDLVEGLNQRLSAGESRDTIANEYQEKAPALMKQASEGIIAFIKQHPSYEASAAIIAQLDDPTQMKEAAQLLTPEVRDGRMKVLYQPMIERMERQERMAKEAETKQATGVEAPDFTLNDINGKPLKLSSLRGKYVVLDFWGSWCIWCIKGFPEMKNYYEKYKGKFEILGVDCNDTEAKWKEAVKKHELPWLHVYNPKTSTVLTDYAVQGFPTKIIVGPDGKIVKTIVGEDPAFYTLLDELFGK